jgi:hypothetical protein
VDIYTGKIKHIIETIGIPFILRCLAGLQRHES